jgi:toxin ParE1/3/4
LFWSKLAISDLEELAEYISNDSKAFADFVEARIHQEARLLLIYPRAGRIGRVNGTRERAVVRTPFILVYRVDSRKVRILRIYRGARRWPQSFA